MKYPYFLSEETKADIDEIYEFGKSKFGHDQAIKYLVGLEESFVKLSANYHIGRTRNDIKKGLYSLPYISHIIFYRILKDKIRIVRVLYGGRDLIRFLD